jgi:hypothetical protein
MQPVITEAIVRESCLAEVNSVAHDIASSIRKQVTYDVVFAALVSARLEGRTAGKITTFSVTCVPLLTRDIGHLEKVVRDDVHEYLASLYDAERYECGLDTTRLDCGYVFLDFRYKKKIDPRPKAVAR